MISNPTCEIFEMMLRSERVKLKMATTFQGLDLKKKSLLVMLR